MENKIDINDEKWSQSLPHLDDENFDIETDSRIDLMIDIETLGTGEDPALLQITAIPFDLTDDSRVFNAEFNVVIDIEKLENINGKTLKWWLNTNKELLTDLINGKVGDRIESEGVAIYHLIDFINKLKGQVYLWGNGILFDNRIIAGKCEKYGFDYPIFYRNDRDVRTINELAGFKLGLKSAEEFRDYVGKTYMTEGEFTKHNARDDVLYQIKCVQTAYKVLQG